jgi:ABC-type nitrate/sulfonate/bicarbonate transport system substrate-binding protein
MRVFAVVMVVVLLASGCGGGKASAPAAATGGPEVREVSMRLQWFPQWQFAGYLVAKVKGFYTEAGLDVTINSGGPDVVSLPLVAAGTDDFGSTGADTVLIARDQGIPVVALATWFQASPVAFMVHADSGIKGPQDFPGHSIGMFYGDNVETEYRALLAATGIDRTSLREVPGDFSIAPFLQRRVDIWPVYATDQPNLARREGADISLIVARDYGVQLMGDVLFTTEEFAAQNPATVRAFVEATTRGWEYALANPDETVDLILAYNPELDHDQLAFEAAETIKLVGYGPGERCPGFSDPTVWAAQAAMLHDLAILGEPADLEMAVQGQDVSAIYAARGVSCVK